MYQSYFGFHSQPFSLTPNTEMFLGLEPHYESIHTIISAIQMGEGVMKITGEVGTGKTMVCRMLIDHIKDVVELIYLPNPVLSGTELQIAIARELGIEPENTIGIVPQIQERLVAAREAGKRTVLIVDEAQALSNEALETLRLFGNLETKQDKLVQLVLIGQPELDERLKMPELRQFRQRITFQSQLRPLSLSEGVAYIDNRLNKSGGEASLFSLSQKKAMWRSAKGIPRLINQLCHKSLLIAFSERSKRMTNRHIFSAMQDTFDACKPKFITPTFWAWSES